LDAINRLTALLIAYFYSARMF